MITMRWFIVPSRLLFLVQYMTYAMDHEEDTRYGLYLLDYERVS